MDKIAEWLKAYIETHPFDPGDSDCETVPDQLYQAYAESHESDPLEISEGFKELEDFLCSLPLEDNNAVYRAGWCSTRYFLRCSPQKPTSRFSGTSTSGSR